MRLFFTKFRNWRLAIGWLFSILFSAFTLIGTVFAWIACVSGDPDWPPSSCVLLTLFPLLGLGFAAMFVQFERSQQQ